MNLSSLIKSLVAVLAFAQMSLAAPIVINDNYVGGGATDAGYATADVIGDNNAFGISKMEVDLSAGQLSVSVFSSYFNNVGRYGTDLGDLFLTTSGWNPVGPSPYYNDKKSTTGTNWTYALVINHTTPGAGQEVDGPAVGRGSDCRDRQHRSGVCAAGDQQRRRRSGHARNAAQ